MPVVGGPLSGAQTLRGQANQFTGPTPPAGTLDNFADVITGDAGNNLIFGDLYSAVGFDAEFDIITAGEGNDTVYGDTGRIRCSTIRTG